MGKNTFLLSSYLLMVVSAALAVGCAEKKFQSSLKTETSQTQNSGIETGYDGKVIYGSDDRKDFYQVTSSYQILAKSTVALMKASDLRINAQGEIDILGDNYGAAMNLCSSERFREQEAAAFCSGSLVAPDLIMTAGHCIENDLDCNSVRFVFDYALSSPVSLPRTTTSEKVFRCKEVVAHQLTSGGADYALIRLDREVTDREPLKVKRDRILTKDDAVFVIGHPSGLPVKITTGGKVRSTMGTHYITDLDTYGGNSGSAVFAASGEVIGILVRGATDFIYKGSCRVSNFCAQEGCRGEDVTRVDLLSSQIPDDGTTLPDPGSNEEVFAAQSNLMIPDRDPKGVESSVNVTSSPNGRNVFVEVNIEHTYVGDLILELVDPSGKTHMLQKMRGGSQRNLRGVFGVDLVSDTDFSAALNRLNQTGVYKLRVSDRLAADVGKLISWKLIFR